MKITHELIDRRCLALHEAVAEKIRGEPELLGIARQNLSRWSGTDGALPPAAEEWLRILDTCSVDEILKRLCDSGEECTRLRQSSPFGGILSEAERLRILKQYEPCAA